MIGRKEGPRINRPDDTFLSLWPKHIFSQKSLPSLILSPQATLKISLGFACLHYLSHTSHPASYLKFTHLIYGFFQCSCWLVDKSFSSWFTPWWMRYHSPFTALDFPCYFCSFTGFYVALFFDILEPKTTRSLCIIDSQDCKDRSKYISTNFVLYTKNRKLREVKSLYWDNT